MEKLTLTFKLDTLASKKRFRILLKVITTLYKTYFIKQFYFFLKKSKIARLRFIKNYYVPKCC